MSDHDQLDPPGAALFLLPRPPRTATVLPGAARWESVLQAAGVELRDEGEAVDLLVGSNHSAAQSANARMVLLEGRGTRGSRRYLPLPRSGAPTLLLPVGHRAAARYLARGWIEAGGATARLKHRLGAEAVGRGFVPAGRSLLTVHAPEGQLDPAVLQAARRAGLVGSGEWFLHFPWGAPWKRLAMLCFPGGSTRPREVLKFSPRRGDDHKATQERRGLEVVARAGSPVTDRAIRHLGTVEVDGYIVAVQTAAAGAPLSQVLRARGRRRRKLRMLAGVADWLRAVARATRSPSERLAPERAQLRDRLAVVSWPGLDDALDTVGGVPAVFTHGDLADGNVVVDHQGFEVIDWEVASPHGWPLWDLLYLCINAMPPLDDAWFSEDQHVRYLTALFLGDHPSSVVFFGWLRSAARDLDLVPEAVPALVSLFLAHAYEDRRRRHLALGGNLPRWRPVERFAEEWFHRPGLGVTWSAWRR